MPENKMTEGQGATLFNHETNTYEHFRANDLAAALASGKYTSSGNVESRAAGGTVIRPVDQLSAAVSQGETSGAAITATRAERERHQQRLDALSDPVLSFSEGMVDALTIGLVHGTSEEDNLRRSTDTGSALMGQIAGTVMGLGVPGAVSGITKGGAAAGRAVARGFIKDIESGAGRAIARGFEEAGANAALMAATGFGHQLTDAVIADKPFAAEVIGAEAGLGAVLGFGAGWLGSTFGRLARSSREAVDASGIAVKETETALSSVRDLSRSMDDIVETHAKRFGVLEVLAKEGHVPDAFMATRGAALKEAESAGRALKELDSAKALGSDAKSYQSWRDAVERYDTAVRKLDDVMSPQMLERASANPVRLGAQQAPPAVRPVDTLVDMAEQGKISPVSRQLDELMTPEKRAAYEEIYGRPYEDIPGPGVQGEKNLGAVVTPTSEQGTMVGKARRASPSPEPQPNDLTTSVDVQPPPGLRSGAQRQESEFNRAARGAAPTEVDPRWADTMVQGSPTLPGTNGQRFVASTEKTLADTAGDTLLAPASKVDDALVSGETLASGGARPAERNLGSAQPRSEVKKYLDDWFKESDGTARVKPTDALDAKLQEALGKLSGSRLDNTGALEIGEALGLKAPTSSLGQRLDQVWSMRQAGKFAADEARGVATPLRGGILKTLKNYALRRAGRGAAAAVAGGALAGPLGAVMGYALTSAGFAGSVASAAGKMMQRVAAVGDALLSGNRARVVVRAAAGNRPHQYGESGPIEDPLERIQELQRLVADPERLRAQVRTQLGDLVVTSPELAAALEEIVVNRATAISVRAPAIYMTPLGKPINPSGTAMQRFFDFENAMHDLPGLLKAVESGGASRSQLEAFQIGYPAVHAETVKRVMAGRDRLKTLPPTALKSIERVLGFPLTRSGMDPAYTMRMQADWHQAQQPTGRPQAFKITAPPGTPVQAAGNGRAPGNERK